MRKGIAITVGTVALATGMFLATVGADIDINIPTTTKQDAKLVKVLEQLNRSREVPYTNIEEALTDKIIQDMKVLIRKLDKEEHENIFKAWAEADETTKNQIRVLLGVQ